MTSLVRLFVTAAVLFAAASTAVVASEVNSTTASGFANLVLAGEPVCEVCHIRYHHTSVSLPQDSPFPACRQYEKASCCNRETAELLHTPHMYGEEYAVDHCGALSPQCQAYFEAEACLYECSPHAGKFRKHTDCPTLAAGEGNLWEMFGMPLSASGCDAWWDACKDDLFCVGPSRTFFDRAHCDFNDVDNDNFCRPFKEIYLNGKELCEIMWSGAFVYTPDGEGESYPLLLDDEVDSMELGDLNHPYDVIMPDLPFPEQCDFIPGDAAECDLGSE